MKRFLFRLESVLALRAAKKDQAQEVYARALHSVLLAERDLSEARAELERFHESLQSSRGGRFQKNDQIIFLKAISYQQSICERKAERLAHFQEEAKALLEKLLVANRAHEILLRLRARQQAQHLREAEKREQVEVDAAVTARFGFWNRKAAA